MQGPVVSEIRDCGAYYLQINDDMAFVVVVAVAFIESLVAEGRNVWTLVVVVGLPGLMGM